MRERLPARRACRTLPLCHEGREMLVTVGYYDDGRIGEVFLALGNKVGSPAHIELSDAAIAASIALQHGAPPDELIRALQRHEDGTPAGALGAALTLAVAASAAAKAEAPAGEAPAVEPVPDEALRRQQAAAQGYTGEACGTCGHFTLVRSGTCLKCDTCGSTTGCS